MRQWTSSHLSEVFYKWSGDSTVSLKYYYSIFTWIHKSGFSSFSLDFWFKWTSSVISKDPYVFSIFAAGQKCWSGISTCYEMDFSKLLAAWNPRLIKYCQSPNTSIICFYQIHVNVESLNLRSRGNGENDDKTKVQREWTRVVNADSLK